MLKNLKKLRQEKGISQQVLADFILVSQQSVNKYENHKVEPDIDTIVKIADYFEVSVDYLIGNTDIRYPADKLIQDKNTITEIEMMTLFKSLSKDEQQRAIGIIQAIKHYDS